MGSKHRPDWTIVSYAEADHEIWQNRYGQLAMKTEAGTRKTKMTTAIDINTNETISIKPIVIAQSDAWDVLLLADANTGKGIWMGYDLDWQIDPEDGDLDHDADKIEGVYGADEDEWEAAANAKLAEYGLKLGDFDEKTGDRYELVEA